VEQIVRQADMRLAHSHHPRGIPTWRLVAQVT